MGVHKIEFMKSRICNLVLNPDVYNHNFGGMPLIHTIGDSFQLPPVFQKPFYHINKDGEKPPSVSNLNEKLVIQDFHHPSNSLEKEANVFVLDKVVRQDDKGYLEFLSRLWQGQLNHNDVAFLESQCLENLSAEEQKTFDNAIHIVPKWKLGNEITYQYLDKGFEIHIAILQAVKASQKNNNCFNRSITMPSISAVCVGAKIMLQTNYIAENTLMNGSISTVMDICYKNSKGPYDE